MTSYLYELPTTGAISFADICLDSTATYTADIADTTEARANLRATLKESKRTDRGEKDDLKLVKVSMLEMYAMKQVVEGWLGISSVSPSRMSRYPGQSRKDGLTNCQSSDP